MNISSEFAQKLIELMEFNDYKIEVDEELRRGKLFIYGHENLIKDNLPKLVDDLNHLIQLVAKKNSQPPVVFDINNYRHEREKLIAELARAAARKALITKEIISLPAMNSYERRLVHLELSSHPEITTESLGSGRERYVVIKPIISAP